MENTLALLGAEPLGRRLNLLMTVRHMRRGSRLETLPTAAKQGYE